MRSFQFILKFFFFVDELGGDITCSSWLRKAVALGAVLLCQLSARTIFRRVNSRRRVGGISVLQRLFLPLSMAASLQCRHMFCLFFVTPNGNRTTGFMSDLILRHPHHAFISFLQNRHLVDFIWRKRLLVSPYQRSLLAFSHGPEKEKLA